MDLLPWVLTALLTLLAILLITPFYSLVSTGNKRILNKKLPPLAAGGWPIMGHLRLLSGPELPHIILSNMADEYGPILSIRLGVHNALIVSSWEIAKECFTTNDLIFCDRPRTAVIQHMSYNFAMFGLGKYGPYWRELRKISTQKLLSNRKIEMLEHLYVTEIRALMRSLYNSCVDNSDGKVLEMRKVFGELSLNVMVRVVAGDVESENEEVGGNEKWHEVMTEFLRAMGVLTVPDVLPYLKWLDCFGGTNRAKKTGKEMDRLLQGWLKEHKKHSRTCERDGSFMAEMMRVADGVAREFPDYDADTITKATCQTMMLGGSGTVAVTLTWILCFLLNNQHSLQRAQEELDKHIGKERLVKESDIEKLVYIKAIIKETLRLQPPGFLAEHKEVNVRGKHFELLPFGAGRRICLGISFSLRLTELALANLLHGFDIEKLSDEIVDMTSSFGATTMKATPLEVRLKPRLPPNLYA
ncbi:UNVERIFIED_CONTAM: cytochrome [Sesamum angustifolium]|uniref:Flavonoid-6-hydroxylase n=1 Tax=Sesamum angustifolium TaxID=2727405 RepID=A0AAW2LIA6_9LAMI